MRPFLAGPGERKSSWVIRACHRDARARPSASELEKVGVNIDTKFVCNNFDTKGGATGTGLDRKIGSGEIDHGGAVHEKKYSALYWNIILCMDIKRRHTCDRKLIMKHGLTL